jgi:tetratricopeptide (TPR) repeat protein
LAQTVLYQALFKSGILEDSLASGDDPVLSMIRQPKLVLSSAAEREFTNSIQRAIALSEQRLKAQPDDTAAMYLLGVSHGLRGNYKFLVQKAWLSALRDSNAGRRLHNRVAELDPSNIDARMLQGLQDYVVASLPGSLRFFGTVIGMKGDKERGLRTLAEVATKGSKNRIDAQILLAALHRREKMPTSSAKLLHSLQSEFPRNYLLPLAKIYAELDAGDTNSAWRSLSKLEPMPAKHLFARGLIQMRSGDLDGALRSFTDLEKLAASGEPLPRARALIHLGYTHDLRGERKPAVQAYQTVVAIAPHSHYGRASERHISRPYRNSSGD